MKRKLLHQLNIWKDEPHRKPLILKGARQVGKTWLLKEFGATSFKNCAYVRLEDNEAMTHLFEGSLEPQRLLQGISAYVKQPISPQDTLLILDEVQAVPRALTALKYFNEDAPEYAIAVAGSLLGLALHSGISFPVGKVSFLDLYPLSFTEYLMALEEDTLLGFLDSKDFGMINAFSERMTDLLRNYYYVGGMPKAVQTFLDTGDYQAVRQEQADILLAYEGDFSKHIGATMGERCRSVWQSAPKQLNRDNTKFTFDTVKQGARGRDYSLAVQMLADCGLITKVTQVSAPELPLKGVENSSAFKMFMVDVGLLGAQANLDSATIIEGNKLFSGFKGALAEQYVCQQLISDCGLKPFYWTAKHSSGELDFLCQVGGEVVPIEVKAEQNLKSKSLASFCKTYDVRNAVRLSLANYYQQDWLTNIPLYAVSCLGK
jgi:predicted AAA+ superfamily ATPase